MKIRQFVQRSLLALCCAGMLLVAGCSRPAAPVPAKPAAGTKPAVVPTDGTVVPAPAEPVVNKPAADKPVADKPVETKGPSTAVATGALDPWFHTSDFNAVIIVHPAQFLNSELIKSLPKEIVAEAINNAERNTGELPIRDFTKVQQIVFAAKTPADLKALQEGPPADAHWVVFATFTEPMTPQKLGELANKPELKEAKSGGKTYFEDPMTKTGLIAINDKTVAIASPAAIASVLEAKPSQGGVRAQLAKADGKSDLIIAFNLEGLNDQLTEMAAPVTQGAPPPIADLTKQLKGGCITAGLSGPSLLKVMLTGRTEDDAKKMETAAKDGVNQLTGFWKSMKDSPQAQAEEGKELLPIADKIVTNIAVIRTAENVSVEVKNPESWKTVVDVLKPAMEAGQKAADKVKRQNQLKQIGLAMFNYHDSHGELPPAQSDKEAFKEGKPLLSWRVHILPFVDQPTLFEKFNRHEAADSETNKPLFEKTPEIYVSDPAAPNEGKTRIVRLTGPEAVPLDKKFTFASFTDGTSNTIMAIELPADKAIPWSSVEDIVFDPAKPLEAIGKIPPEGLQVLMYDGSVQTLKPDITPDAFKALVTPAGGEVINPDEVFLTSGPVRAIKKTTTAPEAPKE